MPHENNPVNPANGFFPRRVCPASSQTQSPARGGTVPLRVRMGTSYQDFDVDLPSSFPKFDLHQGVVLIEQQLPVQIDLWKRTG